MSNVFEFLMASQKVENYLKNENKETEAEDYIDNLKSELYKLQNNKEFTEELQKYIALGNHTRYSIYKFLNQNELCTCILSELFDIKEATLSHHLKILREAGLIEGIKKGLYTIYRKRKND